MRSRIDFLYSAIEDSQSTIRSIDVRAGFIFLILFSPIPIFDKILDASTHFMDAPKLIKLMASGAVVSWILALYPLLMSVTAISNPFSHIKGSASNGSYFSGDLFKLSFLDAFFNKNTKSVRDVDEEFEIIPKTDSDIERELTTEKINLAYIRGIKIYRLQISLRFTIIWVALSLAASLLAVNNLCR